jgi:hypothetical protein
MGIEFTTKTQRHEDTKLAINERRLRQMTWCLGVFVVQLMSRILLTID